MRLLSIRSTFCCFALALSNGALAQESESDGSLQGFGDTGALKEATKPEAPAAVAAPETSDGIRRALDDELSLDDWEREDWTLVKEDIALVELGGYFRFRTMTFRNMDFGNQTTRYSALSGGLADDADLDSRFGQTNLRLRLEPTINLSPSIQVISTLDALDNMALGADPWSLYNLRVTPVDVLSPGQDSRLTSGDNLVVKRAYARVTALNEHAELKFGRMPNHWGLGVFANSGDCFDCDFGDVADRLALTLNIANHLVTPMLDWVATGPTQRIGGSLNAPPYDQLPGDNIRQFSLQIQRIDDPLYIREETRAGRSVWNYGLWALWRAQDQGLDASYFLDDYADSSNQNLSYDSNGTIERWQRERRNANVFGADMYAKLYSPGLRLGFEGAVLSGETSDRAILRDDEIATFNSARAGIDDSAASHVVPGELRKTTINQWGAAMELDIELDPNEAYGGVFELNSGIASGDSAPGFGALDTEDSQRGVFGPDEVRDQKLDAFQFSPAYHVDLLMYRRMLGAVTDTWYVQPAFGYMFDEKFGMRLASTYSQAMMKRSTPSCADPNELRCRGGGDDDTSKMMGLEFDGEVTYGKPYSVGGENFRLALAGGVLFPFAGFRNNELPADARGGRAAWTLQSKFYLTF